MSKQSTITKVASPYAQSSFLASGRYIVSTKADDPLIRTARARQIWAANTAAATQALGIPTSLVGDVSKSPFPIDSIAGVCAAKRRIAELYSVRTDFDLALTNVRQLATEGEYKIPSAWLTNVFPQAGFVHTRDPAVALGSAQRGINFIIEHHDEDYQREFDAWRNLTVNFANCRGVVAITESVKQTLLDIGVPEHKVIVLDSGVNAATSIPRHEEAQKWRAYFLGSTFRHLAVYSGGMQAERGIEDVLQSAQAMPETLFAFCGGHDADIALWKPLAEALQLKNVRFLGYLPHRTASEIQQAADVLILSRSEGGRPSVTSPLKFFEYLMSGKPIVCASIPATERFYDEDLSIHFYTASNVISLISAMRKSIEKFGSDFRSQKKC